MGGRASSGQGGLVVCASKCWSGVRAYVIALLCRRPSDLSLSKGNNIF
jgi:hypothetical protein